MFSDIIISKAISLILRGSDTDSEKSIWYGILYQMTKKHAVKRVYHW